MKICWSSRPIPNRAPWPVPGLVTPWPQGFDRRPESSEVLHNPYNLNRLTQLAGAAALRDQAYYTENCKKIQATRAYTRQELLMLVFFCTDSRSNFLLASSPDISGGELYRRLKEMGILVRHFSDPKIENYVRITIGTKAQMDALLDAIRKILGKG